MTTDLTTRVTELADSIEAKLSEDEAAATAAASEDGQFFKGGPGAYEWTVRTHLAYGTPSPEVESATGIIVFDEGAPTVEQAAHIARNDPARILRRIAATRILVAEILGEPHLSVDDFHYSCRTETGYPCDCGRDQRVARLLGIIAGEWEVTAQAEREVAP